MGARVIVPEGSPLILPVPARRPMPYQPVGRGLEPERVILLAAPLVCSETAPAVPVSMIFPTLIFPDVNVTAKLPPFCSVIVPAVDENVPAPCSNCRLKPLFVVVGLSVNAELTVMPPVDVLDPICRLPPLKSLFNCVLVRLNPVATALPIVMGTLAVFGARVIVPFALALIKFAMVKLVPPGLRVTELPLIAPPELNVVGPAVAMLIEPWLVSPTTFVVPVAVSFIFISPEVVFVLRFVVFTFKAVAALPKLPEVLISDALPVDFMVMVAAPVMLPLAVCKLIEPVEVALPSVAPFKIMLPVPMPPLLVSMSIAEAVEIGEFTSTDVADCRLNEFWLFELAAVIVIGRAPVPGLYPRLLMNTVPVEFAARFAASTLSGAELLPIEEVSTLNVAVASVTVLAWMELEPLSIMTPALPLAVRETDPFVVLVAMMLPLTSILPVVAFVFLSTTDDPAVMPCVIIDPNPELVILNVVPALDGPRVRLLPPV